VSELVLCDQQDHIAPLILNCPEKHNAMYPDMLVASCDYLERLETAAETRVLVIRAMICRKGEAPFWKSGRQCSRGAKLPGITRLKAHR